MSGSADGSADAPAARARDLVAEALAGRQSPTTAASTLLAVCDASSAHLGVDGASVLIVGQDGGQATAAVTDERTRALVEMQVVAGEGPSLDAFELGRPVLVPAIGATERSRWPGYLELAMPAGLGSAFVLPLQVGAARFGVLSLFHAEPHRLAPDELAMLLAFARVATSALVDPVPTMDGSDPAVDHALDFDAHVYQAQGMVMIALGVSLAEALARMRAYAFSHDVSLRSLAADIIDGRQFPPDEL